MKVGKPHLGDMISLRFPWDSFNVKIPLMKYWVPLLKKNLEPLAETVGTPAAAAVAANAAAAKRLLSIMVE